MGEADNYYNANQQRGNDAGSYQQQQQQPSYNNGGYQQQQPGYNNGSYQQPPMNYQQQPPPPPQQYQQSYPPPNGNGYTTAQAMEGGEKHSFDQTFNVPKPKYNDLWAGILVGDTRLAVTFLLRSRRLIGNAPI